MTRKCAYCGKPGTATGSQELRPYGHNGADICYACMVGDAELTATAQQNLASRLAQPGPLLLDPEEHVGPRPLFSKGEA